MSNHNCFAEVSVLPECISISKRISSGSEGVIKCSCCSISNKKYAVKVVDKCDKEGFTKTCNLKKEFKFLSSLSHPNVIRVFNFYEMKKQEFMFMELCEQELLTYVTDIHTILSAPIPAKKLFSMMKQILSGIKYLHQHRIYHRDLKLENILVDFNGNIKIIDFGYSVLVENDKTKKKKRCGTTHYAAPEIINGEIYHPRHIDIWCLGIIFYVMYIGYYPFDGDDANKIFAQILKCKISFSDTKQEIGYAHVTSNFRNLIKKTLKKDPKKRLSLKKMEDHSFFKKG